MDYTHALECKRNDTRIAVVKGSGHHLYFDNPLVFANAILNELGTPVDLKDIEYF